MFELGDHSHFFNSRFFFWRREGERSEALACPVGACSSCVQWAYECGCQLAHIFTFFFEGVILHTYLNDPSKEVPKYLNYWSFPNECVETWWCAEMIQNE